MEFTCKKLVVATLYVIAIVLCVVGIAGASVDWYTLSFDGLVVDTLPFGGRLTRLQLTNPKVNFGLLKVSLNADGIVPSKYKQTLELGSWNAYSDDWCSCGPDDDCNDIGSMCKACNAFGKASLALACISLVLLVVALGGIFCCGPNVCLGLLVATTLGLSSVLWTGCQTKINKLKDDLDMDGSMSSGFFCMIAAALSAFLASAASCNCNNQPAEPPEPLLAARYDQLHPSTHSDASHDVKPGLHRGPTTTPPPPFPLPPPPRVLPPVPAHASNQTRISTQPVHVCQPPPQSALDANTSISGSGIIRAEFCERHSLQKYLHIFEAEDLRPEQLAQLTDEQLKQLGIPMGGVLKIRAALQSYV